ncbi:MULTISPECIES: DUF5709 domain-containing protein [unclassified Streptomyces]|uniref:DUF5709 domain-containing protein n=1 Tax=unclassified Streptomyces TaxID=2593676 RepID=UPI0036FC773D
MVPAAQPPEPEQPDESEQPDEFDPDNAMDTDPVDDMATPGYSPPEHPRGVTRHGTTRREQREGEPLDSRLRQEVPEEQPPQDDGIGDLPGGEGEPVDDEAGATRAGRLAPFAARPGHVDRAAARDVGPDDGTAPAEEAAMHVDTAVDGPERRPEDDDPPR